MLVVGFFPHPDDEAYAAAGTLALCAAAGARVELVCATRGEAGRDRRHQALRGAALGAERSRELARAARAIGSAAPRFLDLSDGAVRADRESVRGLRELLSALAPQLVVTLGRDGAYGHRDHLVCRELLDRALPDGPSRPRVLEAVFPKGVFASVRKRLRPSGAIAFEGELGVTRHAADLIVDIRSVQALKLAALAAHGSQLVGGDPRSFLRPGLVDALLDEEWFCLAAGPPLPEGASHPLAGLHHAGAASHA